ncbi:MAG: hypothetical protein OK454_00410, partial [Thaumarchaeota archaeon]|nr:hypothetical protein [Nitrososphaerota archaeon]
MSDARAYVSSMVEESLGLMSGQLDRHPLSQDFVDHVSSMIRGGPSEDISRPVLEDRMVLMLAQVRDAALKEDGFFVRKARWPGAAPF